MIKRFLTAPALALALFLSPVLGLAAASPAQAAQPLAVATADINLRAGPGTQYPVVDVIPYGASVFVYGCVSGFTWCDVGWGSSRGWVASAYLQVVYRGAPVALTPVIAPRIGFKVVVFDHGYWVRHYPGRPWYRQWNIYVTR